jgi:CO/xanthine dehydrogenase Mo-binding subunit
MAARTACSWACFWSTEHLYSAGLRNVGLRKAEATGPNPQCPAVGLQHALTHRRRVNADLAAITRFGCVCATIPTIGSPRRMYRACRGTCSPHITSPHFRIASSKKSCSRDLAAGHYDLHAHVRQATSCEIGAHDVGQGAWTALAQIAADGLGLNIERLEFRSGSSDLPDAGIARGSTHTATAGMAIHNAGAGVIARLVDLATNGERSPLFGAGNAGVIARGGRLLRRDDESRSESYADILGRAGLAQIEGQGTSAANQAVQSKYAMHAHGAVFAEVKVDPDFGQMRVTRLVGAFAAGRIINPRLVRSQLCGGMIWGVSFALHEQALIDSRCGRPMNANLAEYHIPVNADVPSLEAIPVEEHDPHVNALGIKGVGEIGITGTVGAVANAVWHATGTRVRNFPITLDRLIRQPRMKPSCRVTGSAGS